MQYLNGNIHPHCVAKIAHFEQSSTLMTDVGDDHHPKKVTNIKILWPKSFNCHGHKVSELTSLPTSIDS